MKKLSALLAAALMLILSGCGAKITPAVFTQEESLAIELIDPKAEDWDLFEFLLPETADDAYFTLWRLVDGEWEVFSRTGGSWHSVTSGRLAFNCDLSRLTLQYSLQFEGGGGYVMNDPLQLPGGQTGVTWGCSTLSDETEIALGEPLPVLLVAGTTGGGLAVPDPAVGFADPSLFGGEFADVFVFTIEFSND